MVLYRTVTNHNCYHKSYFQTRYKKLISIFLMWKIFSKWSTWFTKICRANLKTVHATICLCRVNRQINSFTLYISIQKYIQSIDTLFLNRKKSHGNFGSVFVPSYIKILLWSDNIRPLYYSVFLKWFWEFHITYFSRYIQFSRLCEL